MKERKPRCICCLSKKTTLVLIRHDRVTESYNQVPLCLRHEEEFHAIPLTEFFAKYDVEDELFKRGWTMRMGAWHPPLRTRLN